MTRRFFSALLSCGLIALVASCSKDEASELPPTGPESGDMPLNVTTRATEGLVSTDIQVGLYMQHYADGTMVGLLPAHNYIDNIEMNYSDGRWKTSSPIYWFDATTPSDIYAYAPYQQDVADCRQMSVSVPTDQTTTAQLASADLLWGRSLGLNPSTDAIDVLLHHQLSRVNVTVRPEADFAEGELKAADLKLFINNVRCEATMDLQTSELTLAGEALSVCACNNGDLTFTAILIPQSVGFVNLIRVEWKDVIYTLQHSTTFEAQRIYDFTVSINKQEASGLNIGISGWDIDGKDYGGVVE